MRCGSKSDVPASSQTGIEIADRLRLQVAGGPTGSRSPEGRPEFTWEHIGRSGLRVGDLLGFVAESSIAPPRTGHIGNWREIAMGRAAAMDGNALICRGGGLGYPLIFDLTQVENAACTQGDTVHVPGSRVSSGKRDLLELFSWHGRRLRPVDREETPFVPFVGALEGGRLIELTTLHRREDDHIENFPFEYYSSLLVDRWSEVREILASVLEAAVNQREPTTALKLVVDRAVRADGRVRRCRLESVGRRFRLGELAFGSVEALLAAIRIPILAACRPKDAVEHMQRLGASFPLLTAPMHSLLNGLLRTHCPRHLSGENQPPGIPHDGLNVHLHWGAVQMAGFPPRKRGHFASGQRYVRRLFDLARERLVGLDSLHFALLPASIFMLCPSSAYPGDVEAVGELCIRLNDLAADGRSSRTEDQSEVDRVVEQWWAERRRGVSQYFASGFALDRSIHSGGGEVPESGRPLMPQGFEDLTVRQACMLVGALYSVLGGDRVRY